MDIISTLIAIGFQVVGTKESYSWAHYAGIDAPASVQAACATGAMASAADRGTETDVEWTWNGYRIWSVVSTAWHSTPEDLHWYGFRPDGSEITFDSFADVKDAIAKVA